MSNEIEEFENSPAMKAYENYQWFVQTNPKADCATLGIEALKCLNEVDDAIKWERVALSQAEEMLLVPTYEGNDTKIRTQLRYQRGLAKAQLEVLSLYRNELNTHLRNYYSIIAIETGFRGLAEVMPSMLETAIKMNDMNLKE